MNKVELKGTIINDIEIEVGACSECRFFIEVKRPRGNKGDKIVCNAFGETAEIIAGRFKKGDEILILGSLRTVPLKHEEKTIAFLEVLVEKVRKK